jgi:hypothetical protein
MALKCSQVFCGDFSVLIAALSMYLHSVVKKSFLFIGSWRFSLFVSWLFVAASSFCCLEMDCFPDHDYRFLLSVANGNAEQSSIIDCRFV